VLSVDIVIVNWNAGEHLRACLGSLGACRADGWELRRVVVVDNASSDGSLERAEQAAPSLPWQVIRNAENRGFAAACNQGASGCAADLLLFLNPDVVLRDDSLSVPVAFLDQPEHAAVGICGVQLLDESGQVSRSCRRLPGVRDFLAEASGASQLLPGLLPGTRMREWAHDQNARVDQVIGAFFMVRTAVFRDLSGFDERFFVYFEEVDFSLRARQAGWETWYLASGSAFHHGGGCTDQVKAARLFYTLRSRLGYARKHFTLPNAALVVAATLAVEPGTRLVWAAVRRAWSEVPDTVRAYSRLWRDLVRPADRGYTSSAAR